jgi:protein-L-isoaspartate(D-aspartate) O-methyltransferase
MSWEHVLSEDDYRLFKENKTLLEEQVLNHFPDAYKTPEILSAIRNIPRHLFVNANYRFLAYSDNAFPTAGGLTTSAPSVIAEMVSHLRVKRGKRVLEIGTGTGYQAAVLSEMGIEVFSIEIDTHIARTANRILIQLGYKIDRVRPKGPSREEMMRRFGYFKGLFPHRGAIHLYIGNGQYGLEEQAPFHGIILAASIAHPRCLDPLIDQLSDGGGRLVVPVGRRYAQTLLIVEKRRGKIVTFRVEGVTFNFLRLILAHE